MNRSFREIVELVLFGLIAVLVVTGIFWLIGWTFTGVGIALRWLSGLLWLVMKFAIPVAIVGALFYFLVRFIQKNQATQAVAAAETAPVADPAAGPVTPHDAVVVSAPGTPEVVVDGPAVVEDPLVAEDADEVAEEIADAIDDAIDEAIDEAEDDTLA